MSTRERWGEHLEAFEAEAGGLKLIRLVKAADMPQLLAAAVLGDPTAAAVVHAVAESLKQIAHAPRGRPVVCAGCPAPIHAAGTLGVAMPAVATPTVALGFALCPQCAAAASADRAALLRSIHEIWPTARAVEVTHPGGGTA